MPRGRLRPVAAVLAAVVVAEVAVLVLRPRGGVLEPAPVSAASYFSPAEVARARDFRRPQGWLALAVLGTEVAVLVAVVRRPPRRLLGPHRRPLLAAAAAGAALATATTVAALPVGAVMRERAVDVGLITQGWGGWAADRAKGLAIEAALAAAGGLVLVALVRRAPRGWWAAGAVVVVAYGAVQTAVAPVVLDPVFNRFERLPPGELRADVLRLAGEAGVDVGEVYAMDASRRTTAANAYVAGLGRTKRVVLYDTLLRNFREDEVRTVVAHELAHVRYDDVPRGLLFLAVVAPAGLLAVRELVHAWVPEGERDGPRLVPAAALAVTVVAFAVTAVSLQLSREVEARADTFALELTDDPDAFLRFERRIAERNLADPDPPGWRTALFGTHPPTVERLGIGEAWRRGERP